jgi:hypothetical protein
MLASKSGIPKACGIIIAYSNFKMEMGRYYYRLLCGLPRGRKGNDVVWVIVD